MKNKDPEKYKSLKEYDKTYACLYRLNMALAAGKLKKRNLTVAEREEAEKLMERKTKYNEGCRKRQKKYVKNMNKKEVQKNQPKKPVTRQEADKKKD